jgi:hypothetical protein
MEVMTVKDELERARQRAAAGKQPPPLEELRREFPRELGFKVECGEHFEFVDGGWRIIPIAEVEWPSGRQKLIFYPEAPKRPA